MRRTAVINVVGLTERLIGPHTPAITAFRSHCALARIKPAFPAVTCAAQSTYLTGASADAHGIVGNGWYNRELAEVQFWKQSNRLVHGRKLWEDLRAQEPAFTCAKLFWWYNMYSTADYSITPRPMYPADGRKVFDIYTWPYSIRADIKADLGEFPFPSFWGPGAGVNNPQGRADAASRWIANSAKWIEEKFKPTLNLIYLPHLDYNLQRFDPTPRAANGNVGSEAHPESDLRLIDAIVGDLITFFEKRGIQMVLLSEYGITSVARPVHLNRIFRENGWLAIKEELGLELLDAGASKAFAVADHQIAHVYVNDHSTLKAVRELLSKTAGVSDVFAPAERPDLGISHERAGDLIAISNADTWFTYYYWLDDARAPDFARTVDIHRKPGYDPVELFIDPKIKAPKLKIVSKLLKKKLGFRMLMDVIPLDATLIKGSHGRVPEDQLDWPVLVGPPDAISGGKGKVDGVVPATSVYAILRSGIVS
jgi:predicted AlkP superfamily pyrophosphatase or phosphodiesterase